MVGLLCGDMIVLYIDDFLVYLKREGKKVVDVDILSEYKEFAKECEEIEAKVDELFSTRYYPRVYYMVYRILMGISPKKLYLLEQSNGTTGLTMFYYCKSYKQCMEKIRELEGED
jgi:predicted RNA-binding protein